MVYNPLKLKLKNITEIRYFLLLLLLLPLCTLVTQICIIIYRASHWPLCQRFSTQITLRPIFWRKKFPRPATEDFHYLQTFLKASFTLLSTRKLYNSHAHDPIEILHDPLPCRDPSVEKRCCSSPWENILTFCQYLKL